MCCAGSDAIRERKQGCWRGRRRVWFSDSLSKRAGMGWDGMGESARSRGRLGGELERQGGRNSRCVLGTSGL